MPIAITGTLVMAISIRGFHGAAAETSVFLNMTV